MDSLNPGSANLLSARDAREAIDRGLLSSTDLVEACFARIDELEDSIGAWAHLDKAVAMEQARAADDIRFHGKPMGALHGLPVGIKDIIDTADYPTECGTVLHQGRRPERDATLVSLLKEAGAVILVRTIPGIRPEDLPAVRPPRYPPRWRPSRSARKPMAPLFVPPPTAAFTASSRVSRVFPATAC
jgi:hypothetical protein